MKIDLSTRVNINLGRPLTRRKQTSEVFTVQAQHGTIDTVRGVVDQRHVGGVANGVEKIDPRKSNLCVSVWKEC